MPQNKKHHRHSHKSESMSSHRHSDHHSEDRSYCNDFKEFGFCSIAVFKHFMEDYCSIVCGFEAGNYVLGIIKKVKNSDYTVDITVI